MQLGFNTNGLQNHRLDEALKLLADGGYQAVALTPDVGHLDPLRSSPAEVDQIAAVVEQLGLTVVIETGARFVLDPADKHEPTLMTPDPDGVSRRVEFYAACARIGRDLGAEVVSFWAGTDRSPGPDSQSRLHDGIARTAEVIRAAGLRPALEPEPGMAVETIGEFDTVTKAVDVELALDVGHLYVTDVGREIELCGELAKRCAQVHLEDMRRGIHEHLEPGHGDVDFNAVLDALDGGGYSGPVCFELSRSSHRAPAALQACRRVWDEWLATKP